jgi:PIN domain nuclease of toxin-antitoxin system
MTYLDTHVVVWLYAGMTERLPSSMRQRLNASDLYISPRVI